MQGKWVCKQKDRNSPKDKGNARDKKISIVLLAGGRGKVVILKYTQSIFLTRHAPRETVVPEFVTYWGY